MAELIRFGVSMDADLLTAFDGLIQRKGYANRSEAIRDLVRERLVQADWDEGVGPAAAALCLVYDHHTPELSSRLTRIQHEFSESIISTLHVHLSHRDCLEVIVLKGNPRQLQQLADRLISTRGVKHGQLMTSTAGKSLP